MHRNRRSLVAAVACTVVLSCLSVQPAFAQGTPWIAEPGTGSVSLSFVNQKAGEFFRADTITKGPLEATGASLSQNTLWFGVNYAVTDAVAFDIQSGFARSFLPGAVGPAGGRESYSGLGDTNIGVTWRFVDELVSDAPSVALRAAIIAAGSYDHGYINSIGDGGNGFETSLIIGKFGSRAGFSGEIGYRFRSSILANSEAVGGANRSTIDIPSDMFLNLSAFIPANDAITIGVDYRLVNALSGIDIGGEGFSPSRFPGLQEDAQIVGGRLLANVTDTVSVNAFVGRVVAGRNTAKSRVFGVGATFAFGGGGPSL